MNEYTSVKWGFKRIWSMFVDRVLRCGVNWCDRKKEKTQIWIRAKSKNPCLSSEGSKIPLKKRGREHSARHDEHQQQRRVRRCRPQRQPCPASAAAAAFLRLVSAPAWGQVWPAPAPRVSARLFTLATWRRRDGGQETAGLGRRGPAAAGPQSRPSAPTNTKFFSNAGNYSKHFDNNISGFKKIMIKKLTK